jgi:hypothetical protein
MRSRETDESLLRSQSQNSLCGLAEEQPLRIVLQVKEISFQF